MSYKDPINAAIAGLDTLIELQKEEVADLQSELDISTGELAGLQSARELMAKHLIDVVGYRVRTVAMAIIN